MLAPALSPTTSINPIPTCIRNEGWRVCRFTGASWSGITLNVKDFFATGQLPACVGHPAPEAKSLPVAQHLPPPPHPACFVSRRRLPGLETFGQLPFSFQECQGQQ